MMTRFGVCTLVLGSALVLSTEAAANRAYVVAEGDTLWGISKSYGCDLGTLQQENAIEGDHLSVGQQLDLAACKARVALVSEDQSRDEARAPDRSPREAAVRYTIASGDTLGAIATRFHTEPSSLMERNGLASTTIYPGQEILVLPGEGGAAPIIVRGQSIGRANGGRLADATRLGQGRGYYIRRPHRAFGASHTVTNLRDTIMSVKRRFPKLHDLAVGDISQRKGGKISMHASHQSGRDVDLGFYFKKRPKGYPQSFVVANSKNLHFEANWAMLKAFSDLAASPTGVDKIFMSYSTQKIFYKLARKKGIKKAVLAKMFQYPRGRSSTEGIIRHEPGHDEHIHVRFKCPPKDSTCK